MKTAIQELIERLDKTERQLEKENNLIMSAALFAARGMALEYLEKEKEQIIEAYEAAMERPIENYAESYYNMNYNQTYNQNES